MTEDLPDLAAMETFGKRIAARLAPGDVVALTGGLGAGKTTLSRAIIAAFGFGVKIKNPALEIVGEGRRAIVKAGEAWQSRIP